MLQNLQNWAVEVLIKKGGPSAVRGALLGLVGFLAAKNGLLAHFGIATVNGITTIDWSKVSDLAIAGLPAVAAGVIKILSHHTTEAITGGQQ